MIALSSVFGLRGIAVSLACIINLVYLGVLYDVLPSQTCSSWKHIEIAYNFYKYGMLSQVIEKIENKTQKAIPVGMYDSPRKPSINDTVGYGVLVGLLWKMTGICNVLVVQLLQIALFCLMIFFMYGIILLLFQNSIVAFVGSLVIAFWYKLILMNIIPARDIWGYYGGVVLAYVLLKAFFERKYNYKKVFLGAAFFAFCQFLRPNTFGQCITLCVALFLLCYFYKKDHFRYCFKVISLVLLANMLFFWIPFLSFNKIVYDQCFVGPLGHGLLASLGTVDNPWGLKCDDGEIVAHIKKTYSLDGGDMLKMNDAGMHEFLRLVKENPLVYVQALLKTVEKTLFYEIETLIQFGYNFFKDIFSFRKYMIQDQFGQEESCLSQQLNIDLHVGIPHLRMLERLSAKLVMVCGYLGLLLLLFRRRVLPVIFLMGGVFAGCWILCLSHFEERYVIPFAWPFAIFAGYFLVTAGGWVMQRIRYFRGRSIAKKKA